MTAPPKTPPRSSAKNLVMAKSPERVPEAEAAANPKNIYQARKSKRFSIKGILGGETRQERQSRQIEQQSCKNNGQVKSNASIDVEAETVYQVDVDDRTLPSVVSGDSKVSSVTDKTAEGFLAGGKKSYMLKVVLLLMDPETRRFELLQLEFDSDKALVSDVLTQIPVAVTEDVLKKQTYVGICGSAGTEMTSTILLSEFCDGNDVLVAVPSGVPASECARLARPILNDEKVITMLKASGIDATAWQEPLPSATTTPASKALPAETLKVEPKEEEESGSGVFVLVFLVLVAIILQVYHSKITAPIAAGQVLSPGGWVSKCGLASVLPACENSYLEMGDGGILSLFDGNGELEWKMEGAVCKDDNCIDGLEMRDDSRLYIGGKVVQWVNVKKDAKPISPWPFAEEPKIKVIHARK